MKPVRYVLLLVALAVAVTGCLVACTTFQETFPLPVTDSVSAYGDPAALDSDPAETGLVVLDFEVTQQKMLGAVSLSVDGAYIRDTEWGDETLYAPSVGTGFLSQSTLGVVFHGLPPGHYQITKLKATLINGNNTETLRLDVSNAGEMEFAVPPGIPVYVGQFTAHVKAVSSVSTGNVEGEDISYSWQRDPQREIGVWEAIRKRYSPSRWDGAVATRITALRNGEAPPAVTVPERTAALATREVSLGPTDTRSDWRDSIISSGEASKDSVEAGKDENTVPRVDPDGDVIIWERKPTSGSDVVDGKRKRYEDMGPLVASPNGRHKVYSVQRGKQWFMVLDGQESKPYDLLGESIFSPDSKRVAYAAMRGEKWRLVLDGREGKEYRFVRSLCFSPDSRRVAYVAVRGNDWFIVVDGQEGKSCGNGSLEIAIEGLQFSPDSRRVAYLALHGNAFSGNTWAVVVDGQEGKKYDDIVRVLFSPDSRRIGYVASRDKRWFAVVDGKEGKAYDGIDVYPSDEGDNLTFSPDSKHVAYAARHGKKTFIVVDGQESRRYDLFVVKEDGRRKAVWPKPIFDGPNTLRAVAYRDKEFFSVEITLE